MAKLPKPVHQMTEREFKTKLQIGDDDACKAYLKARRWPQGVICPRCGNPAAYHLHSRKWHWQCIQYAPGGSTGCRFSVITGRIFENINKPLRYWFKVVHLMTTGKKGISALQIQRQLGFGSYGTTHSMCHKIRAAMSVRSRGTSGYRASNLANSSLSSGVSKSALNALRRFNFLQSADSGVRE